LNGACDRLVDFVPSLCHSAYGLGECLWAFGDHPKESINVLATTCYEMGEYVVDYFKTVDQETLQGYAIELVKYYENFNQLGDREKGEILGYTLGRYGTDIFASSALLKGISAFKKLREANRICNLESMALSVSSKEAVASRAIKHCSERTKFFETTKIHWDSQNKHVPGKHNYVEDLNKSIFEHKNAEELLRKHKGTGLPVRGNIGEPGYQEIVDFKEHIGIWKCDKGGSDLPTTKGKIHYSKRGAHIVPAHP